MYNIYIYIYIYMYIHSICYYNTCCYCNACIRLYSNDVASGAYERRKATWRSVKLHQPSSVESHFQQNSKYGQKAGFKISVPKWNRSHVERTRAEEQSSHSLKQIHWWNCDQKNQCTDIWDGTLQVRQFYKSRRNLKRKLEYEVISHPTSGNKLIIIRLFN